MKCDGWVSSIYSSIVHRNEKYTNYRAYIVVKNTKLIIVVARNLLAELQTFSAASSNQKHVIVQIP